MKKSFIFASIFVLTIGLCFSQSITVTKPGTGDIWTTGTTKNITWTKSGSMHGSVKLRLFNASGTVKILDIADNTPNDGDFPWTIPGSLAAGNYLVRVKTLDNLVGDDSNTFEIKKGSGFTWQAPDSAIQTAGPQRPDFWIKKVYMTDSRLLKAEVKNLGVNWRGKVKFRFQIDMNTYFIEKDQIWNKNVLYRISSEQYVPIPTVNLVSSTMIACKADPDGTIPELNELNNVAVSHVHPGLLKPDFDIISMYASSTNELFVKVKNLGKKHNGDLELRYTIKGVPTVTVKNCTIEPLATYHFPTGRILVAGDLNASGTSIGVNAKVDPANKIAENSETNNSSYMSLSPDLGIPDYALTKIRFGVITRSSQPRHLPKGNIYVTVKNLGSSYNGEIKIKLYKKFANENVWILYKYENGSTIYTTKTVNLNHNQSTEVKLFDLWWPTRDTTTKEIIQFRAVLVPGSGNPELNTSNNTIVSPPLNPDGPF